MLAWIFHVITRYSSEGLAMSAFSPKTAALHSVNYAAFTVFASNLALTIPSGDSLCNHMKYPGERCLEFYLMADSTTNPEYF